MVRYCIFVLLLGSCSACFNQTSLERYNGNWEGQLPYHDIFHFDITVEWLEANSYQLTIANRERSISKKLTSGSDEYIQIGIGQDIRLLLRSAGDDALTGFVKSGGLMYHIRLKKVDDRQFRGTWDPLMVHTLHSSSIFLSVENNEDGTIVAYPYFGDQRFSGTWCTGYSEREKTLLFSDFKTGMKFQAQFSEEQIQLDMSLAGMTIATTSLSRSATDWEFGTTEMPPSQTTDTPTSLDDGWTTANLSDVDIQQAPVDQLIDDVQADKLPGTHSVLVAKENRLVFEAYFDGHHAHLPHDMRSASKSIASAMIGIAIEDGIIGGTEQKLYDCIPKAYEYTKDASKSVISIRDLLTMSSGLDVNGEASEGNYQSTNTWLKTVLEAKMADPPGTRTLYGSANPFLLGVCLDESLAEPLEVYMDRKLLSPLAISNYIIQTEGNQTTPYFGGGMHLTSRAMLKFGQLYLNRGKWTGAQILSKNWVQQSFQKYGRLGDTTDKNEYGYQWWHKTYVVDNEEFESIEARGAGGQYIFVIPKIEVVVVITSGNFRNRRLLQQPEKILEEYILPAMSSN